MSRHQADYLEYIPYSISRSVLTKDDAPNLASSGLSFCGRQCQEIFEKLKTYVGVNFELEDVFSWSLLQHADDSNDSILPEKIKCNSKLEVPTIMGECLCQLWMREVESI